MSILADLIALVNGNTEKTLDVLIQEKTVELGAHVTGHASTTNNHVSACRDQIQANIQTLLNGRVVKSVQRGVAIAVGTSTTVVGISPINKDKAIVILNSYFNHQNNRNAVLIELTSTSITIQSDLDSTNKVSWQVIEFY